MSTSERVHRFVLNDGEVLVLPLHRAQRTLDVRDNRRIPEVCWELELDSGLVRRVWPNELKSWEVGQV